MKEEKKIMVRTLTMLSAPSNPRIQLPPGDEGTKESMMRFLGFSQKNYGFAIEQGWIEEYEE